MNTLERMERLYSRKYGLADSVYTSGGSRPNSVNIHTEDNVYTIGNVIPMLAASVRHSKSQDNGATGGAVSLSPEKSKIKAYGEFIERYSASYAGDERLENVIFDSYDNLVAKGLRCLDFRDLIYYEDYLYDDPRFLLSRYSTSLPVTWVEGNDLTSGGKIWIPAQKVFLGYPYPKEELRYIWGLSTGLACGSSYYQAALSAVYEVIERDSFMLTWHLQIPGKRIEMDKISNSELKTLYSHILKHLTGEDRLHIYDISKTSGVYTVMTFIRNDLPGAYGLIVSAASHTDPQIAVIKSFEELCQTQNFAYQHLMKDEKKDCQRIAMHEIDTLHKHIFYYSTSRHNHNIDFISKSGEYINLSGMADYSKQSEKENLAEIVYSLNQDGRSAYLVDITKPEIRMNKFHVLKAIIPSSVDLEINHLCRQLKNSRLRKYQKELGVEISSNPHQFP